MTQEKLSRMVTGIVVAATLFLVILFGILISQWIQLGVQNRRLEELRAEAESLAGLTQEAKEDLEEIQYDDEKKADLAMKDGFINAQE